MKKKWFYLASALIILLGVCLRLWHISSPVADWHSWRQADTAAVARNFLKFGIDPLRPRYDDLSNIQSGKDNPEGYRMVEFPVYQLFGVWLFQIFHIRTIEISLRLVSVIAEGFSILFIILLMRRISSPLAAIASGVFFAVLPYSMYYGRTILPEPLVIFFSLASVYFAFLGFDKKGIGREVLLFFSAVLAGLGLLTKPYAVFLLLPLAIPYLTHFKFSVWYLIRLVLIGLIACIPLYLWRQWILHFPEGIPAYTWLFNEGNIRFKPAWVRWLFIERIGKLIFGVWGTVFLVLGTVAKKKLEEIGVLGLFSIGSLLYMSIIARGNVQHDYYQILILPTLVLIAGKGFAALWKGNESLSGSFGKLVIIGISGLLLFSSWYDLQGFYWVNHPEIVEAGEYANRILPKNAKVIAPYNGDTTFLYQINRQGWPIGFEIEKKITMGASYYVTVSPTDSDGETKDLASRYTVIIRNDRFAIIDLTKPKISKNP